MDQITTVPVAIIFSTIVLAMIGSHFHLSRPFLSFLAFRNFRYSWLSREITFTAIVFICTGVLLLVLVFGKAYHKLKISLGWVTILAGFATVYCMANIYLLPTQIAWNSSVTIISSYAVTFLLGTTSLMVIMLMDLRFSVGKNPQDIGFHSQIIKKSAIWLAITAVLAALLTVTCGLYQIELLRNMEQESAQASLQLLLDIYKPLFVMRIGLTILGAVFLVAVVTYFVRAKKPFTHLLGPVYVACIMILVGEILERFLFYATHVRIGI